MSPASRRGSRSATVVMHAPSSASPTGERVLGDRLTETIVCQIVQRQDLADARVTGLRGADGRR